MKQISSILSTIFSPLFVPSYGVAIAFWCTMLSITPLGVRWRLLLAVFGITCLIPALLIYGLYRAGLIKDPGLNNRTERTVPYILTALSYAASAWILANAKAPAWLWLFMLGGLVAVVVNAVVNRWWKISAHLAAMGGLVALAFRIVLSHTVMPGFPFMWIVIATVLAAGAVGTARVYLDRHTLGQVGAGFLNGFLCVFIVTAF
ncbi:MAG: hypothetical protein K2K52_07165 [Paramuribaculum sp.]|nr:hypothetical protein [Paramuribaculum sp.]MDE6460590.1 hypothetical protein [Paramuribaculum sp.]